MIQWVKDPAFLTCYCCGSCPYCGTSLIPGPGNSHMLQSPPTPWKKKTKQNKQTNKNSNFKKMGKIFFQDLGTIVPCWKCKIVEPLWKRFWWFFKKLNINLPYDSVIPFLIYTTLKEKYTAIQHLNMNVHSDIIYTCQKMKMTRVSVK